MYHSRLIISLDFELIWGVFDKVDFKEKEAYFRNTRKMIPELLTLFMNNGIHASWATVGMLLNKDWDQWMANIPKNLPDYSNKKLSAYRFGIDNKTRINENLCFAGELISKIHTTPGQEIATHTYSHYYCLESGQSNSQFRDDLQAAIQVASEKNIQLRSLVFPRNQFNENYLKICTELGIKTVRTNPANWYWSNIEANSFKYKLFRTGDAYLGLKDKSYPFEEIDSYPGIPLQQKASRLLRPKENKLMDYFKLKRILEEITHAAKHNHIYHLWWHPHNFGNDVEGNLDNLKIIIEHFKLCQAEFSMRSNNMLELADDVLKSR
jgi:peptidoglycan/xylan/chitin deacetylase (PgdA/CDA1 family)